MHFYLIIFYVSAATSASNKPIVSVTNNKTAAITNATATRTLNKTIDDCFLHQSNPTQSQWSKNSAQYKERLSAVQKMLIGTGASLSTIDHPDFLNMMKALDPKFKVPGRFWHY